MIKVKVEVVEYISYSTKEITGYECCLTWGNNNKEYLYLYSYRDEYVLEHLKHLINDDDVVLDYIDKGFDYVA